ncbi:nuclear pore complex protein Nup214-like [Pecten maximus]|uniref:nuclear pore complex protein Nup214-like n=1 Tax=Pecten maximus TaxID=6579 RepID=UPI00145899F8|nr:nuclear pore complex protein Nup214-like [Pecten maximus]
MMSEEGAPPPERDVKDFKFQQLCRFRISESPPELSKHKSRLVAASSQYGLAFVGYDTGFKVIRPAELSKIDQANAKDRMTVIIDNFPVVADVKIPGVVSFLALNADELSLAVVATKDGLVQAHIYDVRAFADNVTPVQCFMTVGLTKGGDTRFEDLAWNPVQPNTLVTVQTDGGISLYDISDTLKIVATIPTSSANCVCWSPRGKQLVVGTTDGKLIQYDQGLTKKREWACPTLLNNGNYKVVGVIWLSTFEFLAAFIPDSAEACDQPDIVLIRGSKDGPIHYQNFEDPCFGNGEERERRVLFNHLPQWDMLLGCSSNACEVSILGKHQSEPQCDWERWNLDDSARAELPLTDSHEDTFPRGVAIDFSSPVPIPLGEGSHPPSPILLLLSTDGVLVPYYMMNMYSGADILTKSIKPLTTAGIRKPNGVETDAAGIPSSQNSGSRPMTGLSGTGTGLSTGLTTGLATGPSFQFVSATTKAASTSSFGSPKTTTPSIFGTSSTTSFGSGASFAGFSTTKANAASTNTTSTGAPATTFSFTQQGTSASTTKAATFSFSGSLGSQSQSTASSGFNFGGNSAPSGGSATFSFQTSSSGSSSVFGGPSTTSDIKSTSSFGVAPGSASTATNPVIATVSASSFGFGTSATKSTVGINTSSVSSVSTSKTAGSSFAVAHMEPVMPGNVQLSGGTRPERLPAAPAFSSAGQAQPGQTRQPSAFKGFVTSTQSSTTIAAPQSTTGFKGFVNPQGPQSTTATLPNQIGQAAGLSQPSSTQFGQASGLSQPASSQFGQTTGLSQPASSQFGQTTGLSQPASSQFGKAVGVSQPSSSQFRSKAPAVSIPKTPVTPASVPSTPPTAPVQSMRRVPESNLGPATVGIAPRSGDSEDTFTKGIMEELAHFEEEMSEFRAQTCHGGVLVGTQSEMHQLRGKVEELTNFSTEIITTTKDQTKEVDDQKSLCLDLFAMVEECRLRESRNTDNKYMHLLKARALDPASLDHLRQLQQQYQVLDQGLRDVDAILDQQWTEHQNRDRNRAKIKAPSTDVMYRVLKSNSTLIRNQKANLNNLEKKLKELKLYNKTSAWQHSSSSNNESRDLELSTLADSLLEGDNKPEPSLSSTQINSKAPSPEKQARLREHLARRVVPKIKSTRPENLSMSRIATVDRRRYDLEETVVAHAPEQTFQTYSAERGSIQFGTSFRQPAGSMTIGAVNQAGNVGGQKFIQVQGKNPLTITRQSGTWDISRQNMPPPGTINLPSKYTFSAPTAVPGGLKNLGHIVVEDITPPSSTGYEEEDEEDDDDEEDDEDDTYDDDDDYEEEEDENGVGFGPQYAMTVQGNGDSAGHNTTYTPKTGGFNIAQSSGNLNKNLFGSPATAKSTNPSKLGTTLSSPVGPMLATFGSKPGESSYSGGTQSKTSFTFSGDAGGSAFAFGGTSKAETGLKTSNVAPASTTKADQSAFSMSTPKTSLVSGTKATGFNFGGQAETSDKNLSTGHPLLLQALSEEEDTSRESSNGQAAPGFSFTKPVQQSNASEIATSKQESGSSQEPTKVFGQSTSIGGSLFRVQTSTAFSGDGSGATPITETTVSLSTPVSTVASFSGFGVSSSTPVIGQKSSAGATTTSTGESMSVKPAVSTIPGDSITLGNAAVVSTPQPSNSTTTSTSIGLFGKSEAGIDVTSPEPDPKAPVDVSGQSKISVSEFGVPETANTGLFGKPATTSTGSLFGTAPSTTSTGGLFGTIPSTTSAGGLFGTAPSTTSTGGLFGSATSTTSTGGLFGTALSTTSAGGLFGTAPSTSSTGGLFGTAPSTTSTGGLFGTAPSTSSTGGLFGTAPSTTSTGGLFGTAPSTTSTGGLFGTATTTTTNTATKTGDSLFGATATTSATPSFGVSPSATTTSLFGGTAASTTSSVFGTTPAMTTSAPIFGGTPASKPLFGSTPTPTTSAPSLFGGTPKTTASSGFGGFTSPSFGQSAAFPQSNQSSTLFGQANTTQSGFGQSPSQSQASGDGGLFSGLGGQPSAEKANTNVFGSPSTFGTSATPGTATLFGSQKPAGFGTAGAGTTSPSGGAFSGGFSTGGTGVGSSGFGVGQPQGQGFGGAPSFGGSPTFGSTLGGFGSQPAFGSGATFGSVASFSSPVSTANSNTGGPGFAGFASSNSPTFGSLAGSPDTPTFGSMGGGGGGGGGGFGSPGFGGGTSPGFGPTPSQGFGNTGNNSFGSNPAFSGYR